MSSPTPQERREAADELRTSPSFPPDVTIVTEDGQFLSKSAFYMGNRVLGAVAQDAGTWEEAELALADYIDPTCHAEPVDGDPYHRVRCSVCHTVWPHEAYVRYCFNCGARLVLDDGVAYSTGGDDGED